MWSPEDVERVIINDAIKSYVEDADKRRRQCYLRVRRDYDMGLIGPDTVAHSFDHVAWVARETRRQLLAELDEETPVKRRGDEL